MGIVVGMGVAGQTAALSLSKNGYEVNIYEKSTKVLSPVGAGIALTGGAMCLRDLGVGHICDNIAARPERAQSYELGAKKPFVMNIAKNLSGTPLENNFLFARRDDLLNALYAELEKDTNISVSLGKKATKFQEDKDFVTVTFADESTAQADIAICADGIHSVGKEYVVENKELTKPEHSGLCVFYAMTKEDGKLDPKSVYEVDVGDGAEVVTMPMPNGERLFVVAHEKKAKWSSNSEDWTYSCTPEELYQLFDEHGWFENQDIISRELVKNVFRISHLGIYQQHILPKWHKGRVAIIGDAAHATSPFMGQGANQAIQDGFLIGLLLKKFDSDHDAAFGELFKIRSAVTTGIIKNSQMFGNIRTGNSFKNRMLKKGLFAFTHYAPTFMVRKQMLAMMEPTFLKQYNFQK